MRQLLISLILLSLGCAGTAGAQSLPGRYYAWLVEGAGRIQEHLQAAPGAGLKQLEQSAGWNHFPYAVLTPAVLYKQKHPTNPRYGDKRMLSLALQIGDLLVEENRKGGFESRPDSWWDVYMWLEAYRLLQADLGEARRASWRWALEKNIATIVAESRAWRDVPWYTSAFIGTSTNHYSLWAVNLMIAGPLFQKPEWATLGKQILQRYVQQQHEDGFWGERSRLTPTIGYDHLTMSAVALYYENTRDPAALQALRRSTDFHKYFTYPDGQPVETLNDRNRYWHVMDWGQFAFSYFPDGRGYAKFLAAHLPQHDLDMDSLGRIAQNAIYYHEGPTAPPPQQQLNYSRQLRIPAGIRKTGPWVVNLSALRDTPLPLSQWFLERQAHVSVWNEKPGLILTAANSKNQPELATFHERIDGKVSYLPIDGKLAMETAADRLSLGFQRFFADLTTSPPTGNELALHWSITGMGPAPEEAQLALQVIIKPGEALDSATKHSTASQDPILWTAAELGGMLKHNGWTLTLPAAARFQWPVYPYNPYRNGPEYRLERAVGVITIPFTLKGGTHPWLRPAEQQFDIRIRVN
ncbi:hypothetical protein [Paludibaculum fermentans]|uniref:hypothetical protein n=1 Tax=Paludibaculum fermentans TaxID=1473598 RepID=UPI003EB8D93B